MSGIVFWLSAAFIGYVYAGYPLLIAGLARLRPPRSYPEAEPPALTVIIAAFDEEAVIERKLTETRGLSYPPDRLQVIVAADGSTDRTAEIASRFPDVVVLHRPERRGKFAAMERAVAAATGEVVLFSDANNSFAADALVEITRPFADPAVGAATGHKTVLAEDGLGYSEGLYWRYESAIRRAETRVSSCTAVNGEIFAIRRDLFAPAPPWIVNDDSWLANVVLRAGRRVVYAPDAVSSERVSATAAGEAARRARMTAGQWAVLGHLHRMLPWRRPMVAWQWVSHKLLRPLVPFAMIAAAIASVLALAAPSDGGVLQLAAPWAALAVGAQAVFYGAALLGDRSGALGAAIYVPRFLVRSNLATLQGLARHLRGGQSAAWDRIERRDEIEVGS